MNRSVRLFGLLAGIAACLSVPLLGADQTSFRVRQPTIIAFFPPVTKSELEKDTSGLNEALSDFEVYAAQVQQRLRNTSVEFHVVYAHTFRVISGDDDTTFRPGKVHVGYYFVAPGKPPRVEYGVETAADVIEVSLEYFGVNAIATRFKSPDGQLSAVVTPTGREVGFRDSESIVSIFNKDGALLRAHDFSSSDENHGFTVGGPQWTPDSQYFVVWAKDSHHVQMYVAVVCWSRRSNQFSYLTDYTVDRRLLSITAPDQVQVSTWPDMKPVTVSLGTAKKSDLRTLSPTGDKSP